MEPNNSQMPPQAPNPLSTSQPVEVSTPVTPSDSPKKPTGLIVTTIIFAILALAGVAFGTYGMLSQSDGQSCETDCMKVADGTIEDTIEENELNDSSKEIASVTIDEVKTLLKDKYKFDTVGGVMFDGWYRYTENFNQPMKILFTIYQVKEKFGPSYNLAGTSYQDISYDEFNSAYTYYFGNKEPLEKQDYELVSAGYINEITYQPEKDSFAVAFPDGIGGMMPAVRINKVINATNTQDGFKAIIASVTIDESSADDYSITEKRREDIAKSLSVYEFSFAKNNDDEYIIESIKKL